MISHSLCRCHHACICCQLVPSLMLYTQLHCSWMVRGCWSSRASITAHDTMTCGCWMCPASSGRSWRSRGRRPPHVPTTPPSNFKTASTCLAGMLRLTSPSRLLLSSEHGLPAGPASCLACCEQVSCCLLQCSRELHCRVQHNMACILAFIS